MTFTEPSEGSPTQMSNVAVSWNVVDTPSDFAELNATPGFDGSLVSPAQMSGESTFMLVLTNEGWKQPS